MSGNIRAAAFLSALAFAGLAYRYDVRTKSVIIEPQKADDGAAT